MHHRLSSVAFPHSNCRAEIGVKTRKWLITDNTGSKGELDTDAVQRAVLQYRKDHVFGRPTRDFIPIASGKYRPHKTWHEMLTAREEALRKRHVRTAGAWAEHTKRLPHLKVGDLVRIQNQTEPHPNKWDRMGGVVEVRQHGQYVIKIDGSGRVTLRNRRFLRRFYPVRNDQPPPRSLYNDLAPRVAMLAPVAAPRRPDLMGGPVTPAGPTPPTVLTSVGSPWRGTQPPSVVPVVPGRDVFCAPLPASGAPVASPSTVPDASPPPAPDLRRSTRSAGVPAWHKDYAVG